MDPTVRRRSAVAAAAMVLVAALATGALAASPTPDGEALEAEQYVANAADFVAAADWDAAQRLTIELSDYAFTPSDVTLEAGQPYILDVVDTAGIEHEFVAEDFFRTVATRKAETTESEVKVPYFTEIEVFAGKSAEIYLIPLIPGEYELLCELEGHRESGMEGTITVTGQSPASPTMELADVASGPWVANGPALVEAADWDARQELTIELSEYAFVPSEISLTVGQPYVLTVSNVGQAEHEFVAEAFFASVAFRKAEDASGEFKGPAPLEIEVFAGKSTEIYLIPTAAGTYELLCEIEGHRESGMSGTITVSEPT